ncbi:helix-turn-helix domain-containing protein [Saccharothrix deserti]|uniref:helix-turn-helix domain-containing protein n=1 Tax=Saccharothrix deserti TaxID=2593674 RepID=UPI00131CE95B|nr:helix-turn-helix domain-containing protein [Saccharothrix deserti]
MEHVTVRLDAPPVVVNLGVGVHGVGNRRDEFLLPELWQLHLYGYTAELSVGGTTHPIRQGHVSLVPPGVRVSYRYQGRSEHLYVHLRLSGKGEALTVPVMQDAGADTPLLAGLLRHAITVAPASPAMAAAEVWTVLWRVARLTASGGPHGAVAAAIAHVEANLAEPLTVPDIATAAGVSHNHLTRLFRAETGDTVVAYIRRRRLERARHLLRESTLPIPAVAAVVGFTDLQAFNKACRRELGASPRAVRAGAGHGTSGALTSGALTSGR